MDFSNQLQAVLQLCHRLWDMCARSADTVPLHNLKDDDRYEQNWSAYGYGIQYY